METGGVFRALPPGAHDTTHGPNEGPFAGRRSGNLQFLTTSHRVPVTAALPLRPNDKEKSPGTPVYVGFRGSFCGGTGGI
jgi:hypothetical protein